ncbi:hypothetical protein PFICI_13112 [Pestalotiopsis fici W106-1]|uniref:SP-RING-type domain-containing protein n=1 Tax=Pestalotiopsis fici (strain W106-1 / CGMCC3.15140) TaxID=1229662 RepID=W3WL78_PESFW|nr:uncharacterized protein PFICI_13112 [Pestalotiopsis fici W106-1]ETS74628.1 hypothetical protein PFICI_13112 [Pestalotiopsis fici W106-1]
MAPGHGQRPSSGRSVPATADFQYESSNKTVNKFLGGRQRAWMSNAAPVKPTPRPPKESLHERRPPIRIDSSQQPHQQETLARPAAAAAAAPPPPPPQVVNRPQSLPVSAQTVQVPPDASPALPTPAPSDEPSPALSAPIQPTNSSQTLPSVSTPTSFVPVTTAHFELIQAVATSEAVGATSPDAQDPTQLARTPAVATGQAAAVQEAENHISTVSDPDCGAVTAVQTPLTPSTSTVTPMSAALPPSPNVREQPPPPPAKRQRAGNMAYTLLADLNAFAKLEHQITQSGGEYSLDGDLERPRYSLLRNACNEGDLFFVVLHQLFCCWTLSTEFLHELSVECGADPSQIDNAFGLLDSILKSNSKLRIAHARFFESFPAPLGARNNQFPLYKQTMVQVFTFLTLMSQRWIVVTDAHVKLGYPLLMDELLNTFGLYSTTLQAIVFRASRRNLGVKDGQAGEAMDLLFKTDQNAHNDGNGNIVSRVVADIHNDQRNIQLIHTYKMLVAQARASGQAFQQRQRVPYQPQHLSQQPNTMMRHPNNHVPVTGHASGGAGVSQNMVSAPNGQASATGAFGGNFVFAPTVASQQYSVPSTHFNRAASNGAVNSPTNATFFSQLNNNNTPIATGPQQSPIMAQGQFLQMLGSPGAQFSASPQSSPHLAQSFPSALHSRRSSHHLQAPAVQSPQMQNMMNLPQQMRGSPVQNNMNSVQQTQLPNPSSPHLPPGTSQSPVQMQQNMTAMSYAAHVRANQRLNNAAVDVRQLQPTPSQQQLQQPSLAMYAAAYADLGRQNNSTPNNQSLPPARMHVTATADFRRHPPTRIPQDQHPHDAHSRKSLEMSLHQSHLRSPRRILKGIMFSSQHERYYQYIKYLALDPSPIPQQKYLHVFQFNVTQSEVFKLSSDSPANALGPPSNFYFDGSLRIRIRVCFARGVGRVPSEQDWIVAETDWPEHIQMQLNNQPLMFRRKQHHSKDQPVEVGGFVVAGENILKVSVPVQKPFEKGMPFVAVEVIETLSHTSMYALPNLSDEAVIPAEETRVVIQNRLGGASNSCDDDELAMVSSDLSINITDPFSMSLWNTPVRGKGCTHLECFDLETWLTTRPGKKSCTCGAKRASDCELCPKEPSLVDKWKCPLCSGDARPGSLRIDGYFAKVRRALANQNLLSVKKIQVTTDGSWTPIIPDDDDDDNTDSDDDGPARNGSLKKAPISRPPTNQVAQQRGRTAQVEVICLDD